MHFRDPPFYCADFGRDHIIKYSIFVPFVLVLEMSGKLVYLSLNRKESVPRDGVGCNFFLIN